ncbi:helix-turn-helix domain-containing protein [Ensifer canadensis]
MKTPFSSKVGILLLKTLGTKRQETLVTLIRKKRELAGLTQTDVAKALGEHQSFIARIESGQRRIDVIEYLTLSEVIGFDAAEALRQLISETEGKEAL